MRRVDFLGKSSSVSLDAVSNLGSVLTPLVDMRYVPYPYLMTLVVTRRCNSRCQMCNIWREKDSPFLSLAQIEHVFSRNDFSFVRSLTLTGGEPTLRADLPDLFKTVFARLPNLEHLLLATSGLNTRRTIEHVGQMLEDIESRPNRVRRFDAQISLDGVGEVHDTVRGISGFFDKVQATLGELQALKSHHPRLNVRLSCVLMPYNLPHVGALQEFARHNALDVYFSPIVLSGSYYNNLHGTSGLQFSVEDREPAQRFFRALGKEDQTSLRFYYQDMAQMLQGQPRHRRCMMGFYGFVLEHDGNVYPCVNCEGTSFGNLLTDSFEELWFGNSADALRARLRQDCCPGCTSMCYPLPVNALEVAEVKGRRWARRLRSWLGK